MFIKLLFTYAHNYARITTTVDVRRKIKMPRPVKWRRVEFIPEVKTFIPEGISLKDLEKNVLLVEELEAIRLKDLEGLEQELCAKKMEISRQTFRRILSSARSKVADALINGKSLRIEGGNFTLNICSVQCFDCGRQWNESYENFEKILQGHYHCPYCGSIQIACSNRQQRGFCKRNCRRFGKSKI